MLPDIINVDQTGYVKGRYIGENIRLIQDVIHFTSQMNEKGIAIFLDFKKAFDMIEWTQAVCVTRFDQSERVICVGIFALRKSRFEKCMR